MRSKDIVREFIDSIISGELVQNSRLPSELYLAKKYECNRHTVRKVIDSLIERGYLHKDHNGATFINPFPSNYLLSLCSLFDLHPAKKIKNQVVEFEKITPSEWIAAKLGIDTASKVWHITRARFLQAEPCQIEQTYMPVALFPDLSQTICQASILYYIESEMNYEISHGNKTITAVKLNDFEAQSLHCAKDTIALQIENVGYLTSGRIYEYSITKHINQSITYYAKRI